MDTNQCALEADRADELISDPADLILLYFSLPEGTKKELPVLKIGLYDLMSCRADVNSVVFVNNKGGRSKGVAIRFVGNYIENDDVIIYNVTFESDYGSDKRKIVPITLEKRIDENGNHILWWEDKNFQIPPAVTLISHFQGETVWSLRRHSVFVFMSRATRINSEMLRFILYLWRIHKMVLHIGL